MPRLALLLATFLLFPAVASAQSVSFGVGGGDHHVVQDTLRTAIEELRALDDLIDAADSRSVQRELHRKVMRIEELLQDASRLAGTGGGTIGGSIVITDPDPVPDTVVIIDPEPVPDTVVIIDNGESAPVVVIDEGPIACSDGDFQGVLSAIERESFSSGKLDVLRDAARDRWFKVHQVKRLMKQFTFGKDMVEAGALLHARTVDLENWYQVYDVFTFDSDKDKLRDRVGR